jgi:ABC-type multidrug transport system fused ATPase/permease subunit
MNDSPERAPRRSKNADFRRACGYLWAYRKLVVCSVASAFLVGLILTGGLGGMLPILRVLINEDTLASWIDRQVVEKRFGVRLAEDDSGRVVKVDLDGPAFAAGVRAGDELIQPQSAARADRTTVAFETAAHAGVHVTAKPEGRLLAAGQRVARWFPTERGGWGAVKTIGIIFLLILALGAIGNVVRFVQEYCSDKAAINAVNDLRRHLYDHVLHIPMGFFGLRGTSDVTSRLVSDAQVLQEGFKTVLGQSVQEPIKAMFAFGLALWIDWRLTIFIVVFAPVMGAMIKKFGKKMRRASREALQKSSTMLGQIEGTLTGIRVVKAAGAERFERRRYAKIMAQLRDEQLKMARYEALSTPVIEQMTMLLAGVVLLFSAYLLFVSRTLNQSEFFVFLACMVSIAESLRRVSKLNSVLARSNAAAGRIFETMDMPREYAKSQVKPHKTQTDGNGRFAVAPRIKLPPIQREIVFQDVSFAYANTSSPAVDDVSLRVEKGQSVAVVGRNGSGKTTLLALLPRFFDPQSGRILIDGIDIRTATLRSLRRQIGIVTQEPVIFPGTIAQNIAYGLPRATREQIESAARRAFCHAFIIEKPQGYDTPLDGLGGQLSGGQRQRLNIARAILRDTPILILDEATSQVDAESEHLIQKAVESIMHERTTFVIAHRFSTILSADTIVVMDRGRIVAQGRHDELLATCETYQQLYERQVFTPV